MKSKRFMIPPILFMLLGYFYDILYHVKYGRLMLDSDMSSEMILANILNQEKSILTHDWLYSSEIRVFETQWFYRIGLLISPGNWHMARTIGMALCLLVFAIGFILVIRTAELGVYGLWAAAFAMWPLGFWYCFQFIYGGFYTPYAIFSMYSLFCMIMLIKGSGKPLGDGASDDSQGCTVKSVFKAFIKGKNKYCILLLIFLGYASGLNGVRQMMVFFAPMILAGAITFGFEKRKEFFIAPLIGFVANALGYLTNMGILARIYSFETQSEYAWGQGSGSWLTSIKWLIEMYGYCQKYTMAYSYINEPQDIPLFSFTGISVGCGLLVGFAILGGAVYLILKMKVLPSMDRFLTLSVLSMIFIIGFVFTYLWGAMQYWMQTMPFGFLLLALAVKNIPAPAQKSAITPGTTEPETTEADAAPSGDADYNASSAPPIYISHEIIFFIIAILTAIAAKGTVATSLEFPFRAQFGLAEVVDWIEENTDYEDGAAEFWTSNMITELSDGRIEMYTVGWPYDPQDLYLWLQKPSHEKDFKKLDKYFVLCEYDEENMASSVLVDLLDSELIYNDGKYVVYGVER